MDTVPLHFKDQGVLLDVIDVLRSQGLSSYVSLPQLIVCGDQSAGKSSVLEAISRVSFPTKDNLCTRFATELVLRRDIQSSVNVTILPAADRPEDEKEQLRRFHVPTDVLEDFPSLIEKAKDAMGFNRGTRSFSKDILRVEISNRDQPHLTLVDLPGLIHAGGKTQSTEDVELVTSLVREYMENPRSVILAVVSAKNDYQNQIVTKFARDFDPKGLRTLGIITKPDTLHVGSESEEGFLNLARNEEVKFRLGWHVLRNRDYDSKDSSREDRDNQENNFFSKGVWQTLPLQSLGVESLRPRLSEVLKEQIVSELPDLIRDIELGITDCQKRIRHLGDARGTISEQRLYLIRTSQIFSSLLSFASNGTYDRGFFGDARTDVGYKKRLRAVVQDILLDFAKDMRDNGHFQRIVEDDKGLADSVKEWMSPKRILRSEYLKEVSELMRRTRGRELPGTFNPMIVGDLFFAQARPWAALVHNYMADIIAAARTAVELTLAELVDAATAESLLREVINPALEKCVEQLRLKVEEILKPHQEGHPITYNHYFTETIQKARRDRSKKEQSKILHAFFRTSSKPSWAESTKVEVDVDKLLDALNPEVEGSMDRFACSEATYCMEAYYKVAMKTLVDNFAVLGVEFCLLEGLTESFAAEVVMRLDDNLITKIAAESQESVTERARTQEKLRVLEDGLNTLNRYRRYKHHEPENIEAEDPLEINHVSNANGIPITAENETDDAASESKRDNREGEDRDQWTNSGDTGSKQEIYFGNPVNFDTDSTLTNKRTKSIKKDIKQRLAAYEEQRKIEDARGHKVRPSNEIEMVD